MLSLNMPKSENVLIGKDIKDNSLTDSLSLKPDNFKEKNNEKGENNKRNNKENKKDGNNKENSKNKNSENDNAEEKPIEGSIEDTNIKKD